MPTTVPITKKFVRFDPFFGLHLAFFAKNGLFFYLCLLAPSLLFAQTIDSTRQHTLPPFTLSSLRFDRTGYAAWKPDSLPITGVISLSDRLLWQNALDVRANAPGTLATLSVRGAGPNRTPVFWNGLNLQSPMNGVVDAALLPLWPDDAVEIQYGGQSAAGSSGAMGGSVVLNQGKMRFSEGFSGFFNAAAGSFGKMEGGASLGFSGEKIAGKLRAAWQQADHDFDLQKQGLDGRFYTVRQTNNFGRKADVQQFNQCQINAKNTIKTAFWHQNAFRQLPPSTTESVRKTWQHDRANRALLRWESAPNTRSLWATQLAFLDDYLAFHLSGDTDTSRSRQVLLSTERSANIGAQFAWRTGGSALRQWAQVDGYADSTQWFGQTRLAGFAMGEWHRQGMKLSVLLRQEWAQNQAAPFTGTVGGQLPLGGVGEARFHVSRNFNLPTFNDRFWKNLGNPDLRPEKGYSADLGWVFRKPFFSLEISGFQLVMDDWILWQPDSVGLFRPDNLRKVWSRGAEINTQSAFASGAWKWTVSARLQVSKTTNAAVYGGSENVLGKQLPFTPRVSGGGGLRLSRGIFALAYLQQYTGKRFDNGGKTLSDFSVGNFVASASLWKRQLTLDFRLENVWDVRYEIIRYRPMPGRAWRVGLQYTW